MAVWLAMASVFGAATSAMAADADKPPVPKLEQKISFEHIALQGREKGTLVSPIVRKLSFSPDGRYLGIVEGYGESETDVVIWDMVRRKEQARFSSDLEYAAAAFDDLIWLRGGKVVTFDGVQQWDVMTGQRLADNPVKGESARLTKDGTKMLTRFGEGDVHTSILVYDTKTWSEQRIAFGGAPVAAATWTADNKILAVVGARRDDVNADGNPYGAALRLIDPTGKAPVKRGWLPADDVASSSGATYLALPPGIRMTSSFATNQIFTEDGEIIDGATLNIRRYHSRIQGEQHPGTFGMSLDPSGRWLYLKGFTSSVKQDDKPVPNMIVDTVTGEPVARLMGAAVHFGAIDASPDGRWLAVGDGHSLYLYSLK